MPPKDRIGDEGQARRARLQAHRQDRVAVLVDRQSSVIRQPVDGLAEQEEPAVDLRGATGLAQERDVYPGELAAEPEVLLSLPDDLAHQRRGPALQVVAVVDQVIAVLHEARDGFLFGHDLWGHRPVLVVAVVRAQAVRVDGMIRSHALVEDVEVFHNASRRLHGQAVLIGQLLDLFNALRVVRLGGS